MKIPALSESAQRFLLRVASGSRLEWNSHQGHLGYRLDDQHVDDGTAISELRLAELLSCTPLAGIGPVVCSLTELGEAVADTLRSLLEEERSARGKLADPAEAEPPV